MLHFSCDYCTFRLTISSRWCLCPTYVSPCSSFRHYTTSLQKISTRLAFVVLKSAASRTKPNVLSIIKSWNKPSILAVLPASPCLTLHSHCTKAPVTAEQLVACSPGSIAPEFGLSPRKLLLSRDYLASCDASSSPTPIPSPTCDEARVSLWVGCVTASCVAA